VIITPIFELVNETILLITNNDFTVLIFLFILITLSWIIHKILSPIFSKYYYYFLIPGIAVHELSHFFACLLTGAKVHKVQLFSKKGGFVEHSKSKIPILGSLIISFAPIIGGIVAIFIIYSLANFPSIANEVDLAELIATFHISLFTLHILSFYLIASILVSLVPSSQDIKNSFISLIILFFTFLLLEYFGINVFAFFNNQVLLNIFSFAIIIQMSVLAISLPFYLLILGLKKLK